MSAPVIHCPQSHEVREGNSSVLHSATTTARGTHSLKLRGGLSAFMNKQCFLLVHRLYTHIIKKKNLPFNKPTIYFPKKRKVKSRKK